MPLGDSVFGATPPPMWGGTTHHTQQAIYDAGLHSGLGKAKPSLDASFVGLSRIAKELGEEQFSEMAPYMYTLYKEMKLISDYRKMADILEDN